MALDPAVSSRRQGLRGVDAWAGEGTITDGCLFPSLLLSLGLSCDQPQLLAAMPTMTHTKAALSGGFVIVGRSSFLLLDLAGIRGGMIRRSRLISQRFLQWTGIPTCIGIGPTKTLAKLASDIAKPAERKPGVYPERFPGHGLDGSFAQICHLGILSDDDKRTLFERTAVTEVWGVRPQIGRQLKEIGIATVQDLVQLKPVVVA